MTRRTKWVAGGAVAVVVVGVAGVWYATTPARMMEAYQRVRVGMSREQVYEMAGGPPTRSGDPPQVDILYLAAARIRPNAAWEAGDALLLVRFEGDRVAQVRVIDKSFFRRPWLDRLRDRLGL